MRVLGLLRAGSFLMVLALVPVLGCGKSGSALPTPPPIPQINGNYSGTLNLESASGPGCVGATINRFGLPLTVKLTVTQVGNQLDMVLYLPSAIGRDMTQTFSGTLSGNSFQAQMTGGSGVAFWFVCANGSLRIVVVQSATLTGTGSGTQLSGTYTTNWKTTEGIITVRGRFAVTR